MINTNITIIITLFFLKNSFMKLENKDIIVNSIHNGQLEINIL